MTTKEKICHGECPYCESNDLAYYAYRKYDDAEEHFVRCNSCKKKFVEVSNLEYAFTEFEEKQPNEK